MWQESQAQDTGIHRMRFGRRNSTSRPQGWRGRIAPSCVAWLLWAATAWAEPPGGYTLSWADEFEGSELDRAKWVHRADSRHWSTQLASNVTVSGGFLHLGLRKESAAGKAYTGAGVISRATFKYGYYEARFRVPPGAGWHTSFWLMRHGSRADTDTTGANQEIDICEQDSVDPHAYSVTLHNWEGTHRSYGFKKVQTGNLADGFHVWGCEFAATQVRYFFEGKLVHVVDATVLPHGDHNIWLTSIASHLGGTKAVDDTQLPAAAVFDYVRFYEKASAGPSAPADAESQ
jgi:beta-glucanase (GH16 family)